ncbi:unknown [Prevotella sp. CAG:1320]|jgi:hypothetical protein|nr:hypothetical protein [Prevotella sp.]CDA94347.1 unknown [Prevotella sp. CAG:1320]
MKLFANQRPKGFRHRDLPHAEKRFDFHRDHPRGRSMGNVTTLIVLLALLLALWKIFN